jgi:hypothetical protein
MTFAIFTRSDIVVNPGWAQVGATVLVFIGTSGVAFALFGRFMESRPPDIVLRLLLAAASFVVMFLPGSDAGTKALFTLRDIDLLGLRVTADTLLMAAAVLTSAALIYGVLLHKRLSQPAALMPVDDKPVGRGDASDLIAEAKRELG